jgi:hypothetical protein
MVRLNLGTQVLLSTLFVVFLFGSINFFWVRHEATAALTSELETRTRHHAQSIALETRTADLIWCAGSRSLTRSWKKPANTCCWPNG